MNGCIFSPAPGDILEPGAVILLLAADSATDHDRLVRKVMLAGLFRSLA
jgi:hypothetical protein